MAKQNLLVVDADPRSLRVLEVSLRNAGYNVAGCPSVGKAFEILHANKPDLILSDTAFTDMDGFAFVEQLRQNADWSEIPFMFLSSDGSIESKIRGLELGVQDYLTKPIYIREVIARVNIELARQARAGLATRATDARTRFSGSLTEMSVVDLLQTIDVSRKSGVLTLLAADGQEGMISFESGAVINATVEDLRGEDAIYRQLLWREGRFDLEFRQVSLSERTVHRTTQALLMEGMRRLDEWSRLSELLPSFDTVLEVDAEMLRERLRELPDDQNDMVRLIDGKRPVGDVLRARGGDHVEALRKVVDLYFEGMVREVGRIQDSIPILAEAFVHSSAPPPKEGINTIPGPGGAGGSAAEVSVPAAPAVPSVPSSSTSVTAPEMAAVGAPEVQHEQQITPVSLPSPKVEATDITDEEATNPAGRSAPPQTGLDDEATNPRVTSAPPARLSLNWQPAPPPPPPASTTTTATASSRPRQPTPRGFQQARPEASMYSGGTMLNWAGRVPHIDRIEEISARETIEVGEWDRTLSELRDDPEVDEAIEAIDSDPPPAPFVRSTPPPGPLLTTATPEDARPPAARPPRVPSVAIRYHEPDHVDPPPLTYEQVFDEPPPEVDMRAPKAVGTDAIDTGADAEPTALPWVLLALAVVLGASAVAFVVTQRRDPGTSASAPDTMPVAAPALESRPALADASEKAPTPEDVASSSASTSTSTVADAVPPPSAEPARPVENADTIYPETGAPDTYEAQLALARRLKRGSRAAAAYRRAITLNPEGSAALAELGRLMLARQHTREAAELAERATALEPSNALAWVTLGAARQMRGDRQGARQAYQNCAKLGRGEYVAECRAMLR